ncbi:ATP-binding cassette domain-containing protein [Endothiovibrio diazotrophicus]
MINLHSLLPRSRGDARQLWAMVATFGLFSAANFFVTGHAAGTPPGQPIPEDFFLLSLLSLVLATLARHYALLLVFIHLENNVFRLRLSIIERVLVSSLMDFERLGAVAIFQSMATGTRLLSEITGLFSKILTLGVRGAAVLLALFWLSSTAFTVVLATLLGLGALSLVGYRRWMKAANEGSAQHQRALFAALDDLVSGYKELKLNVARGEHYFRHAVDARLTALEAAWLRRQRWVAANYVTAEGVLLLLGGAMVFLIPALEPGFSAVAVTAAVVAICIPASLLRDAPQLLDAGRALHTLEEIERQLPASAGERPAEHAPRAVAHFARLDTDGLRYRYRPQAGEAFSLGPLSLDFAAGRIHFIVGGNGSGKSTLFKLLTGLYPPQQGAVRVNGLPIDEARYEEVLAPIFFDCHLFDRLYGQTIGETKTEQVNRWLEILQIAHKTRMEGGRLTHLALSSGQKKRVALAMALVEEKPLLLLDEWAADQDPEFRAFFYTELLPQLKREGRTVIAVTHDDRYFHVADHLYRLEYGRLVETHDSSPT